MSSSALGPDREDFAYRDTSAPLRNIWQAAARVIFFFLVLANFLFSAVPASAGLKTRGAVA